MREICQKKLPIKPWMDEKTRRLPGLQLIEPGDWLRVDDVYDQQMAYRCELLDNNTQNVFRMSDTAMPAAGELLDRVLAELAICSGYNVGATDVVCPDGRNVRIDRTNPLMTVARLVQEDLVLMEAEKGQHSLTAAALCFPASWSLDEKFGRDLTGIHKPVAPYTADIGLRVQRLFDFIKAEKPMWRANFLVYSNPDLHQSRREGNRRSVDPDAPMWARVERQCLVKLPVTGAVVFSIHTYVVPLDQLSALERGRLLQIRGTSTIQP